MSKRFDVFHLPATQQSLKLFRLQLRVCGGSRGKDYANVLAPLLRDPLLLVLDFWQKASPRPTVQLRPFSLRRWNRKLRTELENMWP